MPTIIAIESKSVSEFGILFPFEHLYLVKRVTDASGNVVDERVIRGDVGGDGSLVTQANIRLASSEDARGKATLAQRHHTVLDLNGRDPDAVWSLMVQHAARINAADLEYSFDLFGVSPGSDLNSNTVVASALHTVGINVAANLPRGVTSDEVPLFDRVEDMLVHDVLVGSSQSDRIFGGAGNDRLRGDAGNDRLFGEVGTDALVGGDGRDVLNGGFGLDRMNGGLGNDVYFIDNAGDRVIETSLDADGGIDRVESTVSVNLLARSELAGVEQVTLRGSSNLSARGNALDNVLIGNSGDNILSGRSGDDTLAGASGDDRLYGGAGNDRLRGGSGNDILNGSTGQDALSGGSGADVFFFNRTYESLPTENDVIVDFSGADVIDLRGIDGNTAVAGNQAFAFIGGAAFSGGGQLRYELDDAGNTIVQAEVDGDLAVDFQLTLSGYTQALSRTDFIL